MKAVLNVVGHDFSFRPYFQHLLYLLRANLHGDFFAAYAAWTLNLTFLSVKTKDVPC
jgi:hypothetical protein